MIALLKKDLFTLTKQLKLFLLVVVVFSCLPGYSTTTFAVIYAALLPISALAYDERSKWDSLAAMMPYTPGQLVLGKYLLGMLGVAGASLLALVAQTVMAALGRGVAGTEALVALVLTASAGLVMLALSLPPMFRWGVEKGRIAMFLLIGGGTLATMALAEKFSAQLPAGVAPSLLLLAPLAALVILAASALLSVRFYKQQAH